MSTRSHLTANSPKVTKLIINESFFNTKRLEVRNDLVIKKWLVDSDLLDFFGICSKSDRVPKIII